MKRFFYAIAFIPLFILVLLALILGTSAGARLTVYLADELVDGLTLEYQSGQLNDRLTLSKAAWQSPGIDFKANQLTLDWKPTCLFRTKVCVKELSVGQLDFTLGDIPSGPEEAPSSGDDSAFVMPIAVELSSARLNQVHLSIFEQLISWKTLSLSALMDSSCLTVSSLLIDEPSYIAPDANSEAVDSSNEAVAANDKANDGTDESVITDNTEAAPEAPADNDWALAALPTIEAPFAIEVKQLQLTQGHYQAAGLDHRFALLELAANWQHTQVAVSKLVLDHQWLTANATADITLEHPYPLNLDLQTQLQDFDLAPEFNGQAAHLIASGSFADLNAKLDADNLYQLQLDANADITTATIPFELEANVQQLHWPVKAPQYQVQDTYLSANGDLKQQQAELQGTILLPQLQSLQADLVASHNDGVANISKLHISSAQGLVDVVGMLDYRDGISWQASLNADNLLLKQVDERLPEFVSGKLSSTGKLDGDNWQVSVTDTDLTGQYQDIPFEVLADLDIDQALKPNIRVLNLTSKETTIKAQGQATDTWDIKAHLEIAKLENWLEGAKGAFNADINVIGEADNPQIVIIGNSESLRFQEHYANAVELKGFYFPFKEHDFRVVLRTDDLNAAGIKQANLRLGGKGNIKEQFLKLSSQGDINIQTSLHTLIEDNVIKGELFKTGIDYLVGPFVLGEPVNFSYNLDNSQIAVDAHCWLHKDAKLCLQENVVVAEQGEAAVQLTGDIGALLDPLLPDNMDWRGPLTLAANASWQDGAAPEANATLTMPNGDFKVTHTDENSGQSRQVQLDYQAVEFKANLDKEKAQANFSMLGDQWLELIAAVNIDIANNNGLSGDIQLNRLTLEKLKPLFADFKELAGDANASIQLSGNLSDPKLEGHFLFKDGEIASRFNPTELSNIQLDADFDGGSLDLDSSFTVGEGAASLTADLSWPDDKLQGDVRFSGDEMSVIYPPMVILKISPDLRLSINENLFTLSGDVIVPSGKIELQTLPEGGVAVSEDVVFVDSQAQEQEEKQIIDLAADVNIRIGPKVAISGFGLDGKLVGALNFQQDPKKPPLLFGDVRIADGRYKFMGQSLDIPRGEVQFSGPADLPSLNIEAVRFIKSEDVTAGVRITGTPKKPEVNFFSNPTMEQAEILSYIANGRGFSSENSDDNSMLAAAALSMSGNVGVINNLSNSASNLAEKIGFNNVQVDTNDDGRVALSGYIGENLMVKYGVGVLNAENQLTARYFLLPRLYLEVVSQSIEQSLDLYFSFDVGTPEPVVEPQQ
ncbi:autotransporter assembly complex protein TamB [Paraferrimonas haliotis]|uniref:autotransporter assembly complex protein TamB n=1 Tax=Paraferrimonas haliotis TaxID=2013866 RepID=UPI000BA97641|nr:translocation/assembly module TamB domain-containing protein [Paraferrimonas haliotis]